MQLKFNRMRIGMVLLVLTAIDWAVVAIALNGVDLVYAMGAMLALTVVAMVPFALMLKPPVLAAIEGDTLRVGRSRAHLGDILRISTGAATLTFGVRARDADGIWVGAYGERELALPLGRIDGGRNAAERFVAQVEAARQAVPSLPVEAPAPPPVPRPRRDGIDPEVAPRMHPAVPAAARAGFGRKGL
ncbi:MAG: hypothetical protein V4574_07315 [Pseudomonadota bacterium]